MPLDPPSRHACLHVHERAFTSYYHPATILFPHPQLQLQILYENHKPMGTISPAQCMQYDIMKSAIRLER